MSKPTASLVEDSIATKEISCTKFGMADIAAQGQTSDAKQGSLDAYGTGAFGLDSDARMLALYDLVLQIRDTLVANGTMKGSA